MAKAADPTSPASACIHAALLDYFGAPGKYPIGSRQPEILFHAMDDVLQIAAGRGTGAAGSNGVRDAAAFFIGAALLYPGADHYALLGLAAGAEPMRLKERYRLLMRLIHPDFAGSFHANWPTDSAMRVNRAYEVLSSPVHRREYDEQLANAGAHQRSANAHGSRRSSPLPAVPARIPRVRRRRVGKTVAWMVIVLLSLVAVGLLLPHRDPVRLVQKPRPGPAASAKTSFRVSLEPVPPSGVPHGNEVQVVETVPPSSQAPLPVPAPQTGSVEHRVGQVEAQIILRAPASAAAGPTDPAVVHHALNPAAPRGSEAQLGALPAAIGVQAFAGDAPSLQGAPPQQARATPAPLPPVALATASNSAGDTAGPAIRTAAIRSRPAPTLMDAQPLLNQILQSLESGNAEQLLHVLEADARQAAPAQALSRQYKRLVGKAKHVTLSHVEFRGEPRDDVLVVTGSLRLQIGESTVGSLGEKLLLRAEFESRGGRVALTGLSGVTE